ncbi:D-hexose-6-phosphate mutarotase [Thalassotalea sp. M1531]|uniref:Putative glucose-6-phosphate 1-epimerase n=1 Tax=Thalassotalea algicola TaxID=2716224 RepID=A0A7Y0Q6L8_9GAMM|nr:D-hexose-6-phosphate mutarotase [Thalassotalea algicola]NMP31311.1 D-hexose-6-phosphate mutarotase [Thalassotalea algicola]
MSVIQENSFGKVKQLPLGSELEQLVIEHNVCQARLSLYGGQVLSWQPVDQKEVFWLSNGALYQNGKAIRGGIPICWPWFGGYESAGNHGFARQVLWQLSRLEISEETVLIEIVWQGEAQHELWPYAAKVTQRFVFGLQFEQHFTIENLGLKEFAYTGALHSYFSVSDPENVTVPGLDGAGFDCKITGNKQQKDKLNNVTGPLDRIYYSSEAMTIVDRQAGRSIVLTPINVNNWVLWNPGRETAQTMNDIHDGGENEYVCLEAANTDWQNVNAGQLVKFGQVISIESI